MATPIADVAIVGFGASGAILAKELATAGLKVVAFERGPNVTLADYGVRDSIKFIVRHAQLEWERYDLVSFRNSDAQSAVASSPFGLSGLGGQTLHWTGQSVRFMPGDFKVYTNEIASGVADRAKADLTGYDIHDWPISYDDLEPYYERFEWEFGVSGLANTNPYAGSRKRGYPLPPLRRSGKMELFELACKQLGYHPYESATGILSQPYKPAAPYDTRISERQACSYCAHCNGYGCHVNAKAAALYTAIPVALGTGNVKLHTNTRVVKINTDTKGKATGVSYFTPERTLKEQRAKVVIVCGFAFENPRLLLLSGIANSSSTVGKGIFGLGDVRSIGIFDDYIVNGFIGPNAASGRIDDFNGNNFDHTGLGFIRGGGIGSSGDGTPVQRIDVLPPDAPKWGAKYKAFLQRYYTRQFEVVAAPETLAHHDNYLDLDPTLKDDWGVPLPRVTFAYRQNERKMQAFLAKVGESIVRKAGANTVWSRFSNNPLWGGGGTRMGNDPKTSVVNGYCQSHDVPNLFVIGASVFPTLSGYPPTATVSALSYRSAEFIKRHKEWFR